MTVVAERLRYRTVVCDPPWPVKDSGPRTRGPAAEENGWLPWVGRRSVVPYERMSIEAIKGLPVGDLAERDAHLYLWAVNAYLTEAYDVVREWGFRPSTLLTWCKAPMGIGLGGMWVNTTEFVLFARRGSLPALARHESTWFQMTRPHVGRGGPTHSAKPDGFFDLVEQVSPGSYLEMFARRARFGWDYYGDKSLGTAELSNEDA